MTDAQPQPEEQDNGQNGSGISCSAGVVQKAANVVVRGDAGERILDGAPMSSHRRCFVLPGVFSIGVATLTDRSSEITCRRSGALKKGKQLCRLLAWSSGGWEL